MALDDLFKVAAKFIVECYSRTAFLENYEGLGQQSRTNLIAGQQTGDDPPIGFDQDLIPSARTSDQSVEATGCFSTRDVNDCHTGDDS